MPRLWPAPVHPAGRLRAGVGGTRAIGRNLCLCRLCGGAASETKETTLPPRADDLGHRQHKGRLMHYLDEPDLRKTLKLTHRLWPAFFKAQPPDGWLVRFSKPPLMLWRSGRIATMHHAALRIRAEAGRQPNRR